MVKKFDRVVLKKLGDEIEEDLASFGEKHGISIKRGNGSFSDSNATLQVKLSVIGADGQAVTRESSNFKQYAEIYGFKPEDLGRKFNDRGRIFKIKGLNPRAQMCVIVEDVGNGKEYKMNKESVQHYLKSFPVPA